MSGPDAGPAAGASFYALGAEFDWLASAWDGFARDLAETGGTLRHVVAAAAADPRLAAESSGLAALESATDRLVRELVDDAARISRTLATYENADAAVHASVTDYELRETTIPTARRPPAHPGTERFQERLRTERLCTEPPVMGSPATARRTTGGPGPHRRPARAERRLRHDRTAAGPVAAEPRGLLRTRRL